MWLAVRGAGAQRQRGQRGGLPGLQQPECQETDLNLCVQGSGWQQLLVQQRPGFELQHGGRLRDFPLASRGLALRKVGGGNDYCE